jgi:type II secretory pathway pseudopilin PulG
MTRPPTGVSYFEKGGGMKSRFTRARRGDTGFGLIEIVVSMLLLAAVAAAFLPVLATTLVQSANNVTTTAATQLVNEQLELARGSVETCAQFSTFKSTVPLAVVDARGVQLVIARSGDSCPATYPATVSFTATVTRGDTGDVVATATTLIYFES